MRTFPARTSRSFLIPGGREKVFTVEPLAAAATPALRGSGRERYIPDPSSRSATV
jgi:hypothetical protein